MKKQRENNRSCFSPRGLLCRGYESSDFRPIFRFISETIQDMTIDAMEDV